MSIRQELQETLRKYPSKKKAFAALGLPYSGTGYRKFKKLVKKYKLDISHFAKNGAVIKWPLSTKECPICNTEFTVQKGHPKEKITCSHACANSFFRSGKNNPNYIHGRGSALSKIRYYNLPYRQICFEVWPYKCCVCPWDINIEVHHLDGDHKNDDQKNLVPLCANHHHMVESRYKKDIELEILQKVEKFWAK